MFMTVQDGDIWPSPPHDGIDKKQPGRKTYQPECESLAAERH